MSLQLYISIICGFVCLLTIPMIAEETKEINGTSSTNKSSEANKVDKSVYCYYHRKPKVDQSAGWDRGDKRFTRSCCHKHGTCRAWPDGYGGEIIFCRVNFTVQENKMKKCCAGGTTQKYKYWGESGKYPDDLENLMISC